MNYRGVTESVLERSALAWLEALGYVVMRLSAPQSASSRQALMRLNPDLPECLL